MVLHGWKLNTVKKLLQNLFFKKNIQFIDRAVNQKWLLQKSKKNLMTYHRGRDLEMFGWLN